MPDILAAGSGPPTTGLLPLDGIHDPWRWAPLYQGWVGPAYSVTWTSGAVTGSFGPITGATEVDYVIVDGPALPFPIPSMFSMWGVNGISCTDVAASNPGTATAAGSGIVFLLQFEAGYAGPTAPPNPGLDVTTMLGTGVTAGSAYTWPNLRAEPADVDLANGQLAIWYDPTTGAPVVNFKGKDMAGAVFTARLPLILAQTLATAGIPSAERVGRSVLT